MNKFKNPIFWAASLALVLAAGGVDFETLTSWSMFAESLISVLQNPVALIACIVAAYGIFNDNSTKGIDKF